MEEDYAEAANIFKWGKERATEKWLKYTGETTIENRNSDTYDNHQNGFEHGSIEGGFKKGPGFKQKGDFKRKAGFDR